MLPSIRTATSADAEGCLDIYRDFVIKSNITFELEVPSVTAYAERIAGTLATYPWLLAVANERIVGFAYATSFRSRIAYQWSIETSVYVDPKAQGAGVAKRLYDVLFQTLRKQGFVNAYAVISLPNGPSVRFHEGCGFVQCATLPASGYKLGRWTDVGIWSRSIAPPPAVPRAPTPFSTFVGSAKLADLLHPVDE